MKQLHPSVAGLFPELLSWQGRTTLVAKVTDVGLVEAVWTDGEPSLADRLTIDTTVRTKGHPKLTVVDGARLCAYLVDGVFPEGHPQEGQLDGRTYAVAANLETGELTNWRLETKGNNPIAWGPEGWLYVQVERPNGYRVLRGRYPAMPAEDISAGAATGIHSILSGGQGPSVHLVVAQQQIERQTPGFQGQRWTPDGAVVGVTTDDRLKASMNNRFGFVPTDGRVHDPVICRQANGKYTIAAWGPSHLNPLTVLADLSGDDLIAEDQSLPSLDRVPTLNRPFGLACYTFNNFTSRGNLKIPIRPDHIGIETPTIATAEDLGMVGDLDLFAVYSGETEHERAEDSIVRVRSIGHERQRGLTIGPDHEPMRDSVIALAEKSDLLSPRCYRNQGESTADYKRRIAAEYTRLSRHGECWPNINIHRRYNGSTPTLSIREVIEGVLAAFELAEQQGWPGMVLFRIGTSDTPAEVVPYIDRFLAGITGVPERREIAPPQEPDEPTDPVDEPEEPVMADRVFIEDPTKPNLMVGRPLKEVPHGDDLELRLEDGKMLSVLPDGRFTFDATAFQAYQAFRIAKNNPSQYIAERDGKVYRFGRLVAA